MLLEPVARQLVATVACQYPEIYQHHPSVQAAWSSEARQGTIDMGGVLGGYDLQAIFHHAGAGRVIPPRLYLSQGEMEWVQRLRNRPASDNPSAVGEWRIGFGLNSQRESASYPYVDLLVSLFPTPYWFDKTWQHTGCQNIVGRAIRELMVWIASMDVMACADTGLAHLALALGVPTVVVCHTKSAALYSPTDAVLVTANSIRSICVRRVKAAIKKAQHTGRDLHNEIYLQPLLSR